MQEVANTQNHWLILTGNTNVEVSEYTVESLLAELEAEAVLA